jgi:rSAM/selenodomain-associated transferase 1
MDTNQEPIEYDGDFAIAILAKAPVTGYAKTRMIPLLGEIGAANLQRWLMQRTVALAVVADLGPVTLWCAPDTSHVDFAICKAFGPVELLPQPDGDLGYRMLRAAEHHSKRLGTLIVGTDCPALTPAKLTQVADALRRGMDAVVIPAEDGGYVLIGLRQARAEVFVDIDWSTSRVMTQTRDRLNTLGLRWMELPPLWDVDTPADFERLAGFSGDVKQLVGMDAP